MSQVTNILILDDYSNGLAIEALSLWLQNKYGGKEIVDISDMISFSNNNISGGNKVLEFNLYAAAYNYFNLDEFEKVLVELKWGDIDCVQVFVKEQNDTRFKQVFGGIGD